MMNNGGIWSIATSITHGRHYSKRSENPKDTNNSANINTYPLKIIPKKRYKVAHNAMDNKVREQLKK